MNRAIVWLVFVGMFFAAGPLLAQSAMDRNSPDPAKMRQAWEADELKRIEELKETDPAEYHRQKTSFELRKKISQILESFRQNKIDASTAERQLYPLIKEQSKVDLGAIESRIERVKKYLNELEVIKKDPDILIRKRVDVMLGGAPSDVDPFAVMLP